MQSLNTTHRFKEDLDGLTLLKGSTDGLMVAGPDQQKSGKRSDNGRNVVGNHKHNPLHSNVQSTDQAILICSKEPHGTGKNQEHDSKVKTKDTSKN